MSLEDIRVLIAPLFAIFARHEAPSGLHPEEEEKATGRKIREAEAKENSTFRSSSRPFILASSLASTSPARRFTDALHLFIGTRAGLLFTSSRDFFRYSRRSLCFECDCKRAARTRPKNAISEGARRRLISLAVSALVEFDSWGILRLRGYSTGGQGTYSNNVQSNPSKLILTSYSFSSLCSVQYDRRRSERREDKG